MRRQLTLCLSALAFSAFTLLTKEKLPATLESECERLVPLGKAVLCLPSIVGMTECYGDPLVKEICEASNFGKNTFLGCYLHREDFENLQLVGWAEMNQFIRIYTMTELMDVSMAESDLAEFIGAMKSNYLRENWSRLKEEIEANLESWDLDQPVLLEDYRLNASAHTFVFLTRFYDVVTSKSTVQLQFANTALVDGQLVWFTYHWKFEGMESVEIAKAQNDFFAMRFLQSNL